MARRRPAALAVVEDAHDNRPEPTTEAEHLAAVPLTPSTDEEYAAAYDGHTARCITTRECSCNPFAEHPRTVADAERVPWPHWREHLAHTRYLANARGV